MSRLTVEAYNAQDVGDWAAGQPYQSETIHPTRQVQNYAFTTLYTAAAEGRLHIHPDLKHLLSEMSTLEVHQDTVGVGQAGRSEESRVGTEGVSTCRYRWSRSSKK